MASRSRSRSKKSSNVDVDVLDDTHTPSLQEILDHFDSHFRIRLVYSTFKLFIYKYKSLIKRLNYLESTRSNKYKSLVKEWEGQLKSVGDFGKEELWDVVKDHYPEYFSEMKSIQDLRVLRKNMEDVIGGKDNVNRNVELLMNISEAVKAIIRNEAPRESRNDMPILSINHPDYKSMKEWYTERMDKLKSAIQNAIICLDGREEELKIVSQIIASFSTEWTYATDNYMNFVIVGPSGSGKTTFAKHMGRILGFSGLLFHGDVMNERTRPDFIGQYLGTSGPKTIAQLESSREAVLFIDEAYDLAKCNKLADSRNDGIDYTSDRCVEWDSYSTEAMNSMVGWLSQNIGEIIVIAAGYQKDIMRTFMIINEGIPRRMQPMIKLSPLTDEKMIDIFYGSLYKKGIGKYTDTIGDSPQVSYCGQTTYPKIKRIITSAAHDVLVNFMKTDPVKQVEVIDTNPPQYIYQRKVLKYEAADMVMLANDVSTYMTSRGAKIGNGEPKIGIKELRSCAMESILNKIMQMRSKNVKPITECKND